MGDINVKKDESALPNTKQEMDSFPVDVIPHVTKELEFFPVKLIDHVEKVALPIIQKSDVKAEVEALEKKTSSTFDKKI
jgi:hypothetical protein